MKNGIFEKIFERKPCRASVFYYCAIKDDKDSLISLEKCRGGIWPGLRGCLGCGGEKKCNLEEIFACWV